MSHEEDMFEGGMYRYDCNSSYSFKILGRTIQILELWQVKLNQCLLVDLLTSGTNGKMSRIILDPAPLHIPSGRAGEK